MGQTTRVKYQLKRSEEVVKIDQRLNFWTFVNFFFEGWEEGGDTGDFSNMSTWNPSILVQVSGNEINEKTKRTKEKNSESTGNIESTLFKPKMT